jgi:hypothetical protein
MRLLCTRRGDGIAMITRQGTDHNIAPYLKDHLLGYLDQAEKALGAGVVFDGELYVHQVPGSLMRSISMPDRDWKAANAGAPTPTRWEGPLVPIQLGKITGSAASLKTNKSGAPSSASARNAPLLAILEYHVFTYFRPGDNAPAAERHDALARIIPLDTVGATHFKEVSDNVFEHTGERAWLVPRARAAPSAAQISSYAKFVHNHNYEGLMVYNARAPYAHKRTWDLIKIKGTETEWFLVAGAAPEEHTPTANILYQHGGGTYTASGFFSQTTKERFYQLGPKLNGLWALIRFQEMTTGTKSGGGKLRDPKVIYLSTTREGAPISFG